MSQVLTAWDSQLAGSLSRSGFLLAHLIAISFCGIQLDGQLLAEREGITVAACYSQAGCYYTPTALPKMELPGVLRNGTMQV
jgi:hypothetical protein